MAKMATMDYDSQYEKFYHAIEHKSPTADIVSLAVHKRMFSANKWRYYGDDHGSSLHCASYYNHVDLVHELTTRHGVDVNQETTEYGRSALHFASLEGHSDMVRALLSKGAIVNSTNKYGETALHRATYYGRTEVVQYLLANGSIVNSTDNSGSTPLHVASWAGNADLVQFLLKSGANVNSTDMDGDTALHRASYNGMTGAVQCLLANGSSVNCGNERGCTALHEASSRGEQSIAQCLLENGANVNCTDNVGNTPLHYSASSDFGDDFRHLPVAETLLKAGANPTIRNHLGKDGWTPADAAVTESRKQFIKAVEATFNLVHLQKMKPKVVRLAVLGEEAVGKTQFIETVTSSPFKARVCSFRKPPVKGSVEYLAQRTPGVKVKEISLRDRRIVRVLDMGGQPQFIASHRPLVITGFGMYLLVLNLLAGKERMLESGRYWIRFVIATRHPEMFQVCKPPPLFVLFSHTDMMSGDSSRLAENVYITLKDEFHKHFEWMSGNPYIGNCRVRSPTLDRLLADFAVAHEEVSKAMPLEPKINDQIRKALKLRNQSRTPPPSAILPLDEYYRFVHDHVKGVFDKDLASLTTLLDMQADVMLFECQENGQDVASPYVVVDPYHVCHNVLKAILSPRDFKGSNLVFPPHGVIEGRKLDKALAEVGVDPKAGKGLLHFAKICTPNPQQPDSHFFAIHVEAESGTWKEDGGITKPQCGVRVHCPEIPVSPAFLPALQLELSNKTGGINKDSIIWKTGIVVPWKNNVIVMVQQAQGGFDVNITARAKPGHLEHCAVALAGVSNVTLSTAKSVSPGSETELLYLSTKQVSEGKQLTIAYKAEQVIKYHAEKMTLIHKDGNDEPKDIMVVLNAVQASLCPGVGELSESTSSGFFMGEGDRVMPECSSGRALRRDDSFLFDIAEQLAFDMYSLRRFASYLLEESGCGKSGDVFLAGLDINECRSVPSKVLALLKYWIESAPAPSFTRYGVQLKAVLQRVDKNVVAHKFQKDLGC